MRLVTLVSSLVVFGTVSDASLAGEEVQTDDLLTLLDQDMALLAMFRGALGDEVRNWSKDVFLDPELHRMIVRYKSREQAPNPARNGTRSEVCYVVGDTRAIQTAMSHGVHEDTKVQRLSGPLFDSVMSDCLNATAPPFYRYLTIFPGTNYCGAGNVAPRPGILGRKRELDTCCYWHDLCHFSIPAGTRWNNITNKGSYTISACDCDEKFSQCLSSLSSLDSRIVRYVYFDWLRLPCIRLDYPILRCLNTDWFGRCIKYAFDLSAGTKEWQVVSSPFFDRFELQRSDFGSEQASSTSRK